MGKILAFMRDRMIPFYNFRHTFTWVALESLTYYGLLSLHQVVLFQYTSHELYGVIGTTYALSYMCVYFLISGLDKALAPFFSRYSKNKETVQSLIFYQAIPTFAFALIVLSLIYFAKPYLTSKFHYFDFISNGLFMLLVVKIFIEMTRKSLKTILNLTFQSHISAMAEIIAMLLYIVIVWSLFLVTGTITMEKVFVPLVIVISISTLIMAWYVRIWYRQLPITDERVCSITQWQFAKNRLFTMGFHMNRLFFTAEFLVPFFAYKFGLETAGLLKLASKIVSTFSIIVRRVFETASNVMLANVQELSQEVRVTLFSFITTWTNQAIYALMIFFAINHQKLFIHSNSNYTQLGITSIAYYYLLLSLIDSIFIAYEQFYIAQEKAYYLFGINLLCFFSFITAVSIFKTVSPIQTLALLAGIRLTFSVLLGLYSYMRWRIRPSLAVRPTAILGATAISVLFFLLNR